MSQQRRTRVTVINDYEIFYWRAETPTGISGWIVRKVGANSPLSKHSTKVEAGIAVKRYIEGDERRRRTGDATPEA